MTVLHPDLLSLFDDARILQDVRFDVHQLRCRFPSRDLLHSQHDSVHWLHDSGVPDEAMVVLDCELFAYCYPLCYELTRMIVLH